MTGWDVLDRVLNSFSPIFATIFLAATAVICVVGFSRYGLNFFKYGFTQKEVDDLSKKMDGLAGDLHKQMDSLAVDLNKKMDGLAADLNKKIDDLAVDLNNKIDRLDTRLTNEINGLRGEFHTELDAIKVNHFGHLKNFLGELTSILLDKNIINNADKARLDNQLRDM